MDDGAVESVRAAVPIGGGCVRPRRRALGFVPGGDVRRGWRRAESRGGVGLPSAFCVRGPRTAGILRHFRYAYTGDCGRAALSLPLAKKCFFFPLKRRWRMPS